MKKIILNLIFGMFLISLVSGLTIRSVETIPSEVVPGDDFKVEVGIKNNLDLDIKNVGVSLNLEGIPFAPKISSEEYKGEIEEGDIEKFVFILLATGDAEAGTYKIPVSVNYEVNDESKVRNFMISVVMNALPDFILNSESLLMKNQKNELEIMITNKGLAKAKFLEVKIAEAGYDILSQDNVYIGNLDSDDFDSVKFEIFTKDAGLIIIPVTLTYRDATNKIYSESEVLQIKAYSRDEAIALGLIQKNNTLFYFIVIVFLIVVWVVYRRIKKRRKRR